MFDFVKQNISRHASLTVIVNKILMYLVDFL